MTHTHNERGAAVLGAMVSLGLAMALAPLRASAAPAVYPYDLDPATYPDYTRRLMPVPDWGTFHNQPQFVGVRYTMMDADYFTERWELYSLSFVPTNSGTATFKIENEDCDGTVLVDDIALELAATNLVANPGFETADPAEGWTRTAGVNVYQDGHQSQRSMLVRRGHHLQTTVNVTAGQPHGVALWLSVAGRSQGQVRISVGGPDVGTTNLVVTDETTSNPSGLVFWPQVQLIVNAPGISDSILDAWTNHGVILHNPGGYGPGTPWVPNYGQCLVNTNTLAALTNRLGNRFTGGDIGEQDARFANIFESCYEPFSQIDRFVNFKTANRYQGQCADDLGNINSLLVNLWLWHYPVKEGNVMISGAQTQPRLGIGNSQMQYSFIRGAGKQYGVPWWGNVSIFSTSYDGGPDWKSYPGAETTGPSLGLMRRLLLSHYLYGCRLLSFENGERTSTNTVSPIGTIHEAMVQTINEYGIPGVMHAPVALLLDYWSGWMPAQYNRGNYYTWNGLNYDAGDFLTHEVFSMLYPRYEANGVYQNELGAMCDTPYGDMADTLLSDVSGPILKRYGVVVAAGNLRSADSELRGKVESFVTNGGNFVVTAENASRLWPEWGIGFGQQTIPAGGAVVWAADSTTNIESNAGVLYSVNVGLLPGGYNVLAQYGGSPAVVDIPRGSGVITLLLSPYGLNQNALSSTHPVWAGFNASLLKPYVLMSHVRKALADRFSGQRLFSVGNTNLGYITCRRAAGDYLVGLMNNSLTSQTFKISSLIGTITNLTELDLGPTVTNQLGYWPKGYENNNGGGSGVSNVFGGDIRLFRVQVDETNTVKLLSSNAPPSRPFNRMVAMPAFVNLKDSLQRWFTFFDHFDGVKLDWSSLRSADLTVGDGPLLFEPVQWLVRQQVRFIADFSSGFVGGDLTLATNAPGTNYVQSVAEFNAAMDKLALLRRGLDIIITAEELPTNSIAAFRAGVAALCANAESRGINVHFKHRATSWTPDVSSTLGFVDSVGAANLKFAANTADAPSDIGGLLAQAGGRLGLILIAPATNGAAMNLSPVLNSGVPQILDASYGQWETVYRDIGAAWVTNGAVTLAGAARTSPPEVGWSTSSNNFNRYWTARDTTDLPDTLRMTTNFWWHFGGVKVDYKYLAYRDANQCAREGQWLRDRKVKLIVDFSSDLVNYPGMVLADSTTPGDGVSANYKRSTATINEVFDKMQLMGVTNAIIRPTMRNTSTNLLAYRTLCTNAWSRGHIMLHMQHCVGNWITRDNGSYDTPANVASLIDAIAAPNGNLKMAANGCHITNLNSAISIAGGRLGLILLGYPSATRADVDVHGAARLGMSTAAISGRTEPLILDSEYSDWNDTALDLNYLGWPASAPPGTPTNVLAIAGNGEVTVVWGAVSGATRYNVKQSSTSGGGYVTVTNVAGTSALCSGLTNGSTYYFVVSATNAIGEGPNSAEVAATPGEVVGALLAWSGAANGTWDTTSINWWSNGVAAAYADGDAVLFDDTALGNTNVNLSALRAPRSVIVNNSSKDYTISGSAIAGPGSVSKMGSGKLTLNGTNTFAGGVTNRGGTIMIGNAGALGTGALTLNGGALQNGGNYGLANDVVVSGTGSAIRLGSANNLTLNGVVSGAGAVTLGDSTFISSIYLAGTNVMSGGTITVANNENYVRWTTPAAGNANADWVINSRPNHATFDFATGTISFGSLAGNGFIQGNIFGSDSMNVTISVGANGRSTTFAGVLHNNGWGTGPIGLTKVGGGTLTLTGTNDYTGATIVESGTLLISSMSKAKGHYTVASGAKLGVINASVSSAQASNLTLAAGAALEFQNVNSTNVPLLAALDVVLGEPVDVMIAGAGGLVAGRSYPLVGYSGTLYGSVTNLLLRMPYGWRGALVNNASQIVLSGVAVVSTTETQISATLSDQQLQVAWPEDHIGWRLEGLTNSLVDGTNWFTIPGAEATNLFALPLNPSSSVLYLRMVYP